jgi:clan AA aspartic protease (TIGR02281 family)
LISQDPTYSNYRYYRGLALVGLKRYEQALTDYANTIELTHQQADIGEWVFVEMSNTYAALNRHCLAITPIQTWVAIDPVNRDTPRARKLISDYTKQGNCQLRWAVGADTFPRGNDNVILVRASVNNRPGIFILDTGASFVALTAQFASAANVNVSRQTVSAQTANGITESLLGSAGSVRVGRVEATNVPLLVQDRSLGKNVDGLLGMSFLSRFDIAIGNKEWKLSAKK